MIRRNTIAAALALLAAAPACGGWLDDTLKNVGEGLGRRAIEDGAHGAYEGAKAGAKDVARNRGGEDAGTNAKSSRSRTDGASGAAIDAEAERIYSRYDFVPGERTLFYDDFSDTDVGEFPRKWHLKGPRGPNNHPVEVVEYDGRRFLRSAPAAKDQSQHESTQYIRLNRKGDLPEKFTIEFDTLLGHALNEGYPLRYYVFMLDDDGAWPGLDRLGEGSFYVSGTDSASRNTNSALSRLDGKVHRVSVSVNGTFLKVYVDNERVINDPEGVKRPIRLVGMSLYPTGTLPTERLMFTNFRLAEGGKDIKAALDTDGRIVTHGILFDTGKDIIRPESLPTLKAVLKLLGDDPGLKFSIEGHTDNQGTKSLNQPLSAKRAEAVMRWLTEKGIAAARLKAQGFGDSKPIDSNGSPEGRANNRRVEFVKF